MQRPERLLDVSKTGLLMKRQQLVYRPPMHRGIDLSCCRGDELVVRTVLSDIVVAADSNGRAAPVPVPKSRQRDFPGAATRARSVESSSIASYATWYRRMAWS